MAKVSRGFVGQTFLAILILFAILGAFFVFHVAPQSEHERARIFRAMNQVSGLIDERSAALRETLVTWHNSENADKNAIRIDSLEFDCKRDQIICARIGDGSRMASGSAVSEASVTLESIARLADLPYPDAILLIASEDGRVLAGHDQQGRWQQFSDIGNMIQPSEAELRQLSGADAFEIVEALGRGQENERFSGFPARLSRNIGGEPHAIFIASQNVRRTINASAEAMPPPRAPVENAGTPDETPAEELSISQGAVIESAAKDGGDGAERPAAATAPASGPGSGGNARADPASGEPKARSSTTDTLIFAYIVPESEIDRAGLRIPVYWMLNLLLILLLVLLAMPILRLFLRDPAKPIAATGLAAVLFAVVMVLAVFVVFATSLLVRSSLTIDVENELGAMGEMVEASILADDYNARSWSEDFPPGASGGWKDSFLAGTSLDLAQAGEPTLPLRRPPPPREDDDAGYRAASAAFQQDLERLGKLHRKASILRATPIEADGRCRLAGRAQEPAGEALLESGSCAGFWSGGRRPLAGSLDISGRPYLVSWQRGLTIDGRPYTQFLKSKTSNTVSWARIIASDEWLPTGLVPARPGAATPPDGDPAAGTRNDPADLAPAMFVTSMPLALRWPVLPRNFAFAIVLNRDLPADLARPGSSRLGDVLYHTQSNYSLMENIIEESRDQPKLIADLATARAGVPRDMVAITYHGRQHFAKVRSIGGTPWSVVTMFDRSESQDLFAQSIAQALLMCAFWVIILIVATWATPRLIQVASNMRGTQREKIRARSLWIFNPAREHRLSDGTIVHTRQVEWVVIAGFLAVQSAAILLLPAHHSKLVVFLVALLFLAVDYAAAFSFLPMSRRWLRRSAYGALGIAVLLLAIAWMTGFVLVSTALLSALLLTAFALLAWRLALVPAGDDGELPPDRDAYDTLRLDYLARKLALIMVLVTLPAIGFVNLVYTENLKAYSAASMVTVMDRAAQQRLEAQAAAPVLRKVIGLDRQPDEPQSEERLLDTLGYGLFTNPGHPGWFVTETEADEVHGRVFSFDSDNPSGTFSVRVAAGRSKLADFGIDPEHCRGAYNRPAFAAVNLLTPHYEESNSLIRDSSVLMDECRDDRGRLNLVRSAQNRELFDGLDNDMAGLTFIGGPVEAFPIHASFPAIFWITVSGAIFLAIYAIVMHGLAARLTGLYLIESRAPQAVRDALDARLDRNPGEVWDELSDPQKAVLLNLALEGIVNQQQRVLIEDLLRRGFIERLPVLRLVNARLRDYLKHDLPYPERARIFASTREMEDPWGRVRVPLFVIVIASVVLLSYSSPGTMQILLSSIAAMAAFAPFAREMTTRFLASERG